MYSYVFHSIPFLLSILTVLIIYLPSSLCADYYQYSNCSQPFDCGNIKNITYPFWGNGRAQYCGHPDFWLQCQEDDSVDIEIQAQSYQVLDIVKESRLLHIATTYPWKNNCPTQFANSSLPSYISIYYLHQYLTLFYGCPSIPQLAKINKFPCSLNNTDENYYWDYSVGAPLPELSSCNISVKVIVLRELVSQNFTGSQLNMEEVLKTGFIVEYATVHDSFCNNCEDSGGACGYDWTSAKPKCFCYDGSRDERCPTLRPKKRANVRRNIAIALVTGIGGVLAATVAFFIWWSKQSPTRLVTFWKRSKESHILVEEFLENYGSLAPKRYNYSDIKKITNSFKDKVGQGGCGLVYKGKLLDGRLVAVKLLNKAEGDGEDFINEVGSITRTSHVNVVSLLGFCFEGSKRALIYEFMSNGSLDKFIYDPNTLEAKSQLEWKILYQITIGIAKGLEYLHRGCNTRILHFDIKPHNILLDQDFTPKISDFGLAKLCSREKSIISMLDARGTVGYIAPEVISRNFGGVSHKSDVYSFGMMVLEIVGQRKIIDVGGVDHTTGEIYFPQWIYKRFELNEDFGLGGIISNDAEVEIIKKLVLVALWCVQTSPMDRPDMSRVVEMLEARQEILPIPPKPDHFCFPPTSPADESSNTRLQH